MSVAAPPRTRPVFDPVTGNVIGFEPNPDFYTFFGLGPGSNPSQPGSNPAGLGSVDPNTGGVVTPRTDAGNTAPLFTEADFQDYAAYEAARNNQVPDFLRDPITGEIDPMAWRLRAAQLDMRGRPAGMFNQGMEDVGFQNWVMNHPDEALNLYFSMQPDGRPWLTEGEMRIVALTVGPDMVANKRAELEGQYGINQPPPASEGAPGSSSGQTQYGGGQYGIPYFQNGGAQAPPQGESPPPAPGSSVGQTQYGGPNWGIPALQSAPPPVPGSSFGQSQYGGSHWGIPAFQSAPPQTANPENNPPRPHATTEQPPAPPQQAAPPQAPPQQAPAPAPAPTPNPTYPTPGQDMLPPGPAPAAGMIWDPINGIWKWPDPYYPSPPITGNGPY